jgi:hypothetical protein
VPLRDWWPTILSNFHRRHSRVEDAALATMKSYRHLAEVIPKIMPYQTVSTSMLFKDRAAGIRGVEMFTGLKFAGSAGWIYDADRPKHKLLERHSVYAITKDMLKEANERWRER